MKNILKLTFVIALLFSFQSKAQSLDTLNYLKQFEANKANYIGQPFSKLLNDLTQIQPKTIWATPLFKSRLYTYKSTLNFCNKEDSFGNVITLSITWQDPIDRSQTRYYEEKNNFFFTNDERIFYGGKVIKDIKVYR